MKATTITRYTVSFECSESRYLYDGQLPAANFMLAHVEDADGEDVELYAERPLTEDMQPDGDDFYDELRAEIIEQAAKVGVSADRLTFYYDD